MKNKTSLITFLLAISIPVSSCRANVVSPGDEQVRDVRQTGTLNSVGSMATQRAAHTATLLPDGKVLVAGGFAGEANSLSSAEVFDATVNKFASAGNMTAARAGHTATLLPNGKVLIAGGYNGSYLSSAELFDHATRTFMPASKMVTARSGHVATLLHSGKVLLVGGTGVGWSFLADAELYDPATNSFTATGSMLMARESHIATLLANGKVLITGGHKGRRPSITIYSSAEIYDPATGLFSATGDMTRIRHKHEATLLTDGRVLVVGGADEQDGRHAYTSAEIYNPATGTFTINGNMNASRYKLQGTAVLLNNGKVLIAGGADRAEIFDPGANRFSYVAGNMGTPRFFATATLLKNGQVLITGGYSDGNVVSANAWIFQA
jgi:hypothetical protein